MQGLAILGSTGSIGRQTLEVVDGLSDRFRVVALAAGRNVALLREQAARYRPDLIAVDDADGAIDASSLRDLGVEVIRGGAGLSSVATHPDADIVVVASAGHAAIEPTYRAILAGKTVALANKETIVCAGELIVPVAAKRGVEIRPVDSEHSAIWQSLGRSSRPEIARIILTASGGPFRETPAAELAAVTVARAMAHPTWAMGDKITIDSATMMNKGLEVIETHWLFGVPYDRIDVVVHPESIVHSLVEFVDRSQIAQLSLPDMRLPIQYALTFPEHVVSPCRALSLADIGALHFAPPDLARFPALKIARDAGKAGATYPTVLSAADEIAVQAFAEERLSFLGITEVVSRVLDQHRPDGPLSFEAITAADRWAREHADATIRSRSGP